MSCHRLGLKLLARLIGASCCSCGYQTDSAGHQHCLQQLQSPRNCYALRKLQKAQETDRRAQAAGTEACLKSRSA